ncbi:MAG: type I DNA topoisomerase, partial [Candidatus Gribaldobacteria bacterium]|nr:type I DNA topoisomerase [Candidatus Gribaldobacteria bacterium]
KKSQSIILATDSDREGEAIAFHLAEILGLENPNRIVFHEITKSAIEKALENPRKLDLNLVDAQQARRVLDRLVGYKLSPFLWKKLMRGLSAGRVQSVAVRLICERESEIKKFVPQEYWSLEVLLKHLKTQKNFKANLIAQNDKTLDKLEIKTDSEAQQIIKDLANATYQIVKVEKKETQRHPQAPFTTSTLQQVASSKLHFTAQRTMMSAQKLYEYGLITYHRTDSLNLSAQSQISAKDYIIEKFGKNYWPGFSRNFKTKSKSAQEAHEAIRPTIVENLPELIKKKSKLTEDQFRLYDLIWRRFLASQMQDATFDSVAVDISAKNYTFRSNGQTLKFDGFLKIYPVQFEEADLPDLKIDDSLEFQELLPEQHFTQPPARYSEATLIKVLEKEGIGRPSTYAPIIGTILKRNYVEKDDNKKLKPTETGTMVDDLLVKHFPEIVEIGFTAQMEDNLDKVAEGKKEWVKTIREFYEPFEKNLKQKEQEVVKKDLTEKTDKICPKCQAPMVIRLGRFGKFYACSKFPECKQTENLPRPSLAIVCPQCEQGQIVEKHSKKGKVFYGCPNWPTCDFALWDKPTGEKCPDCGSLLVETKSKKIKCPNKNCTKPKKIHGKRIPKKT